MLQPTPAYHRMREAYARWFWLTPAALMIGALGMWLARRKSAADSAEAGEEGGSGRGLGRLLIAAALGIGGAAVRNWMIYQENRTLYKAE
jgi:hypothetical protein